jgi:dihydroxy-acid dehydratase
VLCKVSPSSQFHVEDVNRAGGILGILNELDKGGLIDNTVNRIDGLQLSEAVKKYDITRQDAEDRAKELYGSAPAGIKNLKLGSQGVMFEELDTDRSKGCIRDIENCYNQDGGLGVLFGNIAEKGSVVKTAGVDESIFLFKGPAVVFESQEEAIEGILGNKVKEGDVVIIRYEGPKGGPGMQEMLYPTSYIKSKGLGKTCALITDGRFSGGTSGLSIGHVSPEAAAGGKIALIQDGDLIQINIPERKLEVLISEEEMIKRKKTQEARGDKAYTPKSRDRQISKALQVYASMVTSADTGAIREI